MSGEGGNRGDLGDTLHVVPGADADAADGTEERPFPTLPAAVAAANADIGWYGLILMHAGRHELPDGDIPLPTTAAITVASGATLALGAGVSIIARRAMELRGTEDEPVTLTWLSEDAPWAAVVVTDTLEESVVEHAVVEHSDGRSVVGGASGGISVIRSSVRVVDSAFRENGGAHLTLRDSGGYVGFSTFDGLSGWGVNIHGGPRVEVEHNRFVGSLGDGVRLHDGSLAFVHHNLVVGSADKGISIGDPGTAPAVEHNVIAGNGYGISITDGATPVIAHNTLYANRLGVAVYHKLEGYAPGAGVFRDGIVWASVESDIALESGSTTSFRYSCIQNPLATVAQPEGDSVEALVEGPGIIAPGNGCDDPLFIAPDAEDPETADFHVESAAGRWDPQAMDFVSDDETSPCVDAGDPDIDVGEESEPNGARSELGAYGATAEASRTP